MAPRTFSVVSTVQDPLTAQRLVEVLQEAGVDAFHRAQGAASSAPFGAASPGYYELFVPTEALLQAEGLVKEELAQLERDGAANARAAEEEALSGEHPVG